MSSYFLNYPEVTKKVRETIFECLVYNNVYDFENYTYNDFSKNISELGELAIIIAKNDDCFLTFILESNNPTAITQLSDYIYKLISHKDILEELEDMKELLFESAIAYYNKTLEYLFDYFYPEVVIEYMDSLRDEESE